MVDYAIRRDESLAFLSKNVSNSSHISCQSKICSDWLTLLNKGQVTSFSIIPSALVLAEKTISLTSCFPLDIFIFHRLQKLNYVFPMKVKISTQEKYNIKSMCKVKEI